MGKLGEVLAAHKDLPKGPPCTMTVLIAQMDADDREALAAALRSNQTSALIARAMTDAGFEVQSSTVRRHRRGECACE